MTDRRRSQAAGAVPRVVAAMALVLALASPSAWAQASSPEPAGPVGTTLRPEALAQQEQSGRSLARKGIGLLPTGLVLTALGTGLFYIPTWGGIISGGVIAGAGGALFVSSLPLWVTGAVRRSLARAGNPPELRRRWSRHGMITFFVGLAMATTGAITLGLSAFPPVADEHFSGLFISGVTLLPLGALISLLVGVPMWVEPHRSVWQQASPAAPGAFAPHADVRDPFSDRWTFRRLGPALPAAFLVSSPVFSF